MTDPASTAALFAREDWTLFRNIGTIGQKAGVPREQLAALAMKELADNALDAGATCRVYKGHHGYVVEDDGPGIPGTDAEIATLFSIRRPLTSSKLLRLPTRGALGNGLRVVTGCVLASGGELRVRTGGRHLLLTPQDDGTTAFSLLGADATPGTRVEITFGPELAKQERPLWMAELAIALRGESRFEGLSSPHWYDSDGFYELLQASGQRPLGGLLASLHGGNTKGLREMADTPAASLTRLQAEAVMTALREAVGAPAVGKLGVVGADALDAHGYAKRTAAMRLAPARGAYSADIPVVIECWATRRREATDEHRVTIYVNRTPITARIYAQKTGSGGAELYVSGCGLRNTFKVGRAAMHVNVCITAPYMPITTDGKEPNLRPLLDEIEAAMTAATRKAKTSTSDGRRVASQRDTLFGVLQEAISIASGGRKHRYSLRQLYYKVRPLMQREGIEGELAYGYFGMMIGDYETAFGDLPGMYRDPRGSLQHPHEQGQIALGTLTVEKYKRPDYEFNKVLYIEKGGFLPVLIDEDWGRRHDCAILTSQGFASRAARDLLDLLGATTQDLEFFCIHDADGPGTLIYEALVEGTKARPGRKVTVTNLGLDPWEAEAMGLDAEDVDRKRGAVPVAGYIKRYDRDNFTDWADWLQSRRYELNAMSTPQFLTWLDEKMATHSKNTKVIPPPEVLVGKYRETARKVIRDDLVAKLIEQFGIEAQADALLDAMEVPADLGARVGRRLRRHPEQRWDAPLEALATEAAKAVL